MSKKDTLSLMLFCALSTVVGCLWLSPKKDASSKQDAGQSGGNPSGDSSAGRDSTIWNFNFQSVKQNATTATTGIFAVAWAVASARRRREHVDADTLLDVMHTGNCEDCMRKVCEVGNKRLDKRIRKRYPRRR